MAEGVGFEPTIRLPVYTLSKRAPSATRPSLRARGALRGQVEREYRCRPSQRKRVGATRSLDARGCASVGWEEPLLARLQWVSRSGREATRQSPNIPPVPRPSVGARTPPPGTGRGRVRPPERAIWTSLPPGCCAAAIVVHCDVIGWALRNRCRRPNSGARMSCWPSFASWRLHFC